MRDESIADLTETEEFPQTGAPIYVDRVVGSEVALRRVVCVFSGEAYESN